ncbi:hypothetical protein CYANOKiyG1_00680 [Okeania sp. KiyG1]|nr:hypothetical protein CYANOKiyG1_00680 [Okeania sp. KiyG1]
MVVVLTALTVLPLTMAPDVAVASPDWDNLVQLKNVETNRYLFSAGNVFPGEPGDEGGWLSSPPVLGSDANYYNRGQWYLEKRGDAYTLKNVETNRYAFSTGDIFTGEPGDEGGWLNIHPIVGADANYYNRAQWYIVKQGDAYRLENKETNRQLFSTGSIFTGEPGDEGGWLDSPVMTGSDANYYNRSLWEISGPGASLLED